MIEDVYTVLTEFRHTHPIHPKLTHVQIGLTIGVILLVLVARIRKCHRWHAIAFHMAGNLVFTRFP